MLIQKGGGDERLEILAGGLGGISGRDDRAFGGLFPCGIYMVSIDYSTSVLDIGKMGRKGVIGADTDTRAGLSLLQPQ